MMKVKENELINPKTQDRMNYYIEFLYMHYKTILTKENFKDSRCEIIEAIKYHLIESNLKSYIMKPMKNELVQLAPGN